MEALLEEGGGTPRKIGYVSVQPASQNPCLIYLIYDQNLQFSLPYLLPYQIFDTLFMSIATGTVALKVIYEGLLVMIPLITMTKKLLVKNMRNSRLQSRSQTLFMTKTDEKSYPMAWGCTYITHIGEYPPPPTPPANYKNLQHLLT